MLLGYHLLWSTTANLVRTDEQKDRIQKLIIENNYFVGGSSSTCPMSCIESNLSKLRRGQPSR